MDIDACAVLSWFGSWYFGPAHVHIPPINPLAAARAQNVNARKFYNMEDKYDFDPNFDENREFDVEYYLNHGSIPPSRQCSHQSAYNKGFEAYYINVLDRATRNPSRLTANDLQFIKTTNGVASDIESRFDSDIKSDLKRWDDYKEFGLKQPTPAQKRYKEYNQLIQT